jgi:hypothetical protein
VRITLGFTAQPSTAEGAPPWLVVAKEFPLAQDFSYPVFAAALVVYYVIFTL